MKPASIDNRSAPPLRSGYQDSTANRIAQPNLDHQHRKRSDQLAAPVPRASNGGRPGYLIVSLDTELAWGFYDDDSRRKQLFSADGSRERRAIEQMLGLLDGHGLRATWALVGHLFFSRCEDCHPCPVAAWRDDNQGFAEVHAPSDRGHPLWYATDVRDRLLAACGNGHELAFHGFSHRPFHEMDRAAAEDEIDAWLRLAGRFGVKPESIVFPRGRAAHLAAFGAAGFRSFRAPDQSPRWHLRRFGSALKAVDDLLAWSTPPVFSCDQLACEQGLLRVPSSAHLFDFPRALEQRLDRVQLQHLRLQGVIRALRRAAKSGGLVHLWAHPWELRTQADLDKVERVFEVAAQLIDSGSLQSVTMGELARTAATATRWGQTA